MKKFALIGSGITHSLSPALFAAAYKGMPFTYTLIDRENLSEAVDYLLEFGFAGANITSPFKQDIIGLCSWVDNCVREIGAANLVLNQDGLLSCYNTDYIGVRDAITSTEESFESALVIGAGGAARAAVYALKSMNLDFIIANRSAESAKTLAYQFGGEFIELDNISSVINKSKLIIYTIDNPVCQLEGFNFSGHTIFEANYKSPVFKRNTCNRYISGMEWLLCQAVPSFRIFTQIEPDVKAMYQVADNR
jgi:shikimate dehydrogenase